MKQRLVGHVGGRNPIGLTTRSGRRIRTLTPGRYEFIIRDASTKDNFHLIGPRVSRKTSVPGKGTFTWTLTLRRGVYIYRSDAHRVTVRGSFRVRPKPAPRG